MDLTSVLDKRLSRNSAIVRSEADELIEKGVVLHEELNLKASTECFLAAANLGSPLGMYLYGLALKSGWGCQANVEEAFHWFSKAADMFFSMKPDCAMTTPNKNKNKNTTTTTTNTNASPTKASEPPSIVHSLADCLNDGVERSMIETTLGMILYELAYCCKDMRTASKYKPLYASYLQMAAHIGDPHAQLDLATNYLYGLGVKVNKNLAAKYFRLASKAGLEIPGNSWIWKSKYDTPRS